MIGIFKGKTVHIASVNADEDRARETVNMAARLCENHGIKANLHPIASSQKASLPLLNLIKDLNPSLIVMGAFGQSGIAYFFMGSCANDLLKSTDVPLFVYH